MPYIERDDPVRCPSCADPWCLTNLGVPLLKDTCWILRHKVTKAGKHQIPKGMCQYICQIHYRLCSLTVPKDFMFLLVLHPCLQVMDRLSILVWLLFLHFWSILLVFHYDSLPAGQICFSGSAFVLNHSAAATETLLTVLEKSEKSSEKTSDSLPERSQGLFVRHPASLA